MARTIYGKKSNEALIDGEPIKMIARYGRNGIKYVWIYPSQKKLDDLIYKYGLDQVADGVIINSEGKREIVNCAWLEYSF